MREYKGASLFLAAPWIQRAFYVSEGFLSLLVSLFFMHFPPLFVVLLGIEFFSPLKILPARVHSGTWEKKKRRYCFLFLFLKANASNVAAIAKGKKRRSCICLNPYGWTDMRPEDPLPFLTCVIFVSWSLVPSISVTYWKPPSIRFIASSLVVAALQVHSSFSRRALACISICFQKKESDCLFAFFEELYSLNCCDVLVRAFPAKKGRGWVICVFGTSLYFEVSPARNVTEAHQVLNFVVNMNS